MSGREILDEVNAYLARTGTARTAFSVEVLGGTGRLARMEKAARRPHDKTVARLRAFMAAHPAGLSVGRCVALTLDRRLANRLLPAARARGIAVADLAVRVLETCVSENMIDAVLDDG